MYKVLVSILSAALFVGVSFAQTSAQAQASGSASQSSSASVSRSGAQAQSQTSANAAAESAVSNSSGRNSAEAAGSSQLTGGSTFHARLDKTVDARKCKPGDRVVATSTQNVKSNGEVVIPKGSKLIGHVTQAQARTKGDSRSAVGIAFDHAVLKNGEQVPLNASIQAIAASQQSAEADMMDTSMDEGAMAGGSVMNTAGAAPRMGGGLVGGATRAVGTTGGVLVNTAGSVGGNLGAVGGNAGSALSATGELNSAAHGVVGMRGLSLEGAAAGATQASAGSVISSTSQNVHLNSGTQMILQVAGK
jgi:hypothetical protein